MQLERFDAFVHEINSDQELKTDIAGLRVYRYFDRQWFDEAGAIVDEREFRSDLSRARALKKPWRSRRDSTFFFQVTELDAYVTGTIASPVTKARISKYTSLIDGCLKHSTNAFNATHDNLTGLLNKAGFEVSLDAIAANQDQRRVVSDGGSPDKIQAISAVSLVTMDIDHFKQVNDSYGHPYGDVVLRCFARRIQQLASAKQDLYGGKLRFSVARPGGEEFAVLIEGNIPASELQDIGEGFRKVVAEPPMPSEDEWDELDQDVKTEIRLPPLGERRVTVSIGLATTVYATTTVDHKRLLGDLINKADTALYRAKAGGRNVVRDFTEILTRHGRVLEHHPDTEIVTIDIGSLVGVNFGQEFLVYHPDFSGEIPFIYSDGRTKKRLGNYPKVPCGRIMVFDVQNEISFARVTHRVEGLRFPAGSVLEAVPAGSIAHILALDSQIDFGMSGLAPAEELPQTVRTIVEQKHVPFVAVFSILNLSGVTKRRGQIFVNEALTKLYQAIREIFGAGVKIGQTQPAEVAVITESSDVDENISLVKATLKIAHERCKGQITFKAGLFDSSALVKQKGAGDQSKIDVGRALDLARYAASEEAGEGDAGIVSFTPNVATGIVAASRMKGAYSKALEDYKRFTEYGIRIANLENQAALAQFSSNEQGSGDAAIASINRAIELKPSEAAFHANLGFLEFYRGNWAASCASYVKAYEVNKKFEMVPVYYYSYAMGRAHVAQQRPNDVQFLNDTKAALEQALQQTDVGKANQTNLQSMLNQVNSLILAA